MADFTVTPGKVFSAGEPITEAKLNSLGSPTVAIAAGVTTATDILNYFRDPDFNKYAFGGNASAVFSKEYLSRHWFLTSAGAGVTAEVQDREEQNVDNIGATSAYALKITGATSVTQVDLGQYIPQHIAQELATTNFTVAFQVYNNTGASVTPSLRISTSNTDDDPDTVTFDSATNMTACPNGASTLCKVTIDGTTITNLQRGAEFIIRLPSTLNAGTEEWWFQKAQLVTGTDANTAPPRQLFNPSIPCLLVREEQTSGTDGGGSTASGGWDNQRTLNTIVSHDSALIQIGGPGLYGALNAGNDGIKLAPGYYWFEGSAPFIAGSACTSMLALTTDGIAILTGAGVHAAANEQRTARVSGPWAVTTLDEEIGITQRVSVARATDGLGQALSYAGVSEVYAQLRIWRLSDPV